jgi:ubiquinone/menaquinone biosynthesis C-methylase UbiE
MDNDKELWDKVSSDKVLLSVFKDPQSIYLHKKRDLLKLINRWFAGEIDGAKVLKTDLMEESLRADDILFDLSERAKLIVGMDISPELTRLSSQRGVDCKDAYFTAADARKLPFKDNSFEVVISNSTLDHFPQIDKGLSEVYRVLKPAGTAIITIHSKLDFTFYLFHALKKVFNYSPHLHFERTYTPAEIRDRLYKTGFKVENFATTTHIPMGLWAIFQLLFFNLEKVNKKLAKKSNKIIDFYSSIIEKIENKGTVLNYLLGLLIAFKVRK